MIELLLRHRTRQGDALGHLAGTRRGDRHLQTQGPAPADRRGGRPREAPETSSARAAQARPIPRTIWTVRSTSSARPVRGCARSSARQRLLSCTRGCTASGSRRATSSRAMICAPSASNSSAAEAAVGEVRTARAEIERRLEAVGRRREAAEEALAARGAQREELSRRRFAAQSAQRAHRLPHRGHLAGGPDDRRTPDTYARPASRAARRAGDCSRR